MNEDKSQLAPRLVLASLEKTTYACPTQYEGKLVDGRVVYMRYRWGKLSVRVAGQEADLFTSKDTVIYCETIGEEMAGVLDNEELIEKLSHLFDFGLVKEGLTKPNYHLDTLTDFI